LLLQNLASEEHQVSHVESQGTPTIDGSNGEQYYGEGLHDPEIEDMEEFWKSVTQGDFLMANSAENPDSVL
jgi:hypothetical protein